MKYTKKLPAVIFLLAFSLFFFISGCKVVKHTDKDKKADTGGVQIYFVEADFDPDEFTENVWDQVVSTVLENLTEYNLLLSEFENNLDDAFEKYGFREHTENKPYNFYTTGKAKIIKVEEGFNAKLHLDVEPFDGVTDLYLLTAPIIRNDTVRDGLEFLKFSDFKNQLEFGRLSKSLNKKVYAEVIEPKLGDLTEGAVITFSGIFTYINKETLFELVPFQIIAEKQD